MNTPVDRLEDNTPPSDDVRAGEYVLGVLDRGERALVQARMTDDTAFASLVDAWEARFAPWLLRVTAVAPSPHVWPRIRTGVGWSPVERTGVWNSVAFWRGAAVLAAAAGVAAITFALLQEPVPQPAPTPRVVVQPAPVDLSTRPVTVLARDDGSTGWIATVSADRRHVRIVPVPAPADAKGRVNELWVIPAGGAPISLGLVSRDQAQFVAIPVAAQSAMTSGATLAVTLEQEAGIPHAAPTGPIIAKGSIDRI